MFSLIESILKVSLQLLVVVLWVLQGHRARAFLKATNRAFHETRLLQSFSFLGVFLLKVGMLNLFHAILAELRRHICGTYIDRRIKVSRRYQALIRQRPLILDLALRHHL